MKRFLSILSFVCFMGVVSQASAQNANGLVGQAIAAYNTNCGSFQGPLEGQVNVLNACFFQGFITEVLLFPKVNCNQVDCDLIRLPLLARVVFDCGNNVMSVECLFNN